VGNPEGGWMPGERLSIEEAIRGWTTWAAWAGFEEDRAGQLAAGRPADVTVLDIDPFETAAADPGRLLAGRVLMTVAGGRIIHQ